MEIPLNPSMYFNSMLFVRFYTTVFNATQAHHHRFLQARRGRSLRSDHTHLVRVLGSEDRFHAKKITSQHRAWRITFLGREGAPGPCTLAERVCASRGMSFRAQRVTIMPTHHITQPHTIHSFLYFFFLLA